MSNLNCSLPDWRGSITVYDGPFSTTPVAQHEDQTWEQLGAILRPKSGPMVAADKRSVAYVTPGLLQDAPLVGKTRERAQREGLPTVGKQRSANHVTTSMFVIFDIDGLSFEQVKRIIQNLKAAGITFLAYTSWSFGLPDKPGVRARFVIPVDRPLNNTDYEAAWHGANQKFFEGAADSTGSKLCQQQGVWATAPDRAHLARRWGVTAGVASADVLMALAPKQHQKQRVVSPNSVSRDWDGNLPSMSQIQAAIAVFDPNEYTDWDMVVSLTVALSRGAGMDVDALKKLVTEFSDRADEARRAGNDKAQYSPTARFDHWTPSINPSIAAATLFATARDRATAIYRQAVARGNFKGTKPAWSYLAAYHPKQWNALRAITEATA